MADEHDSKRTFSFLRKKESKPNTIDDGKSDIKHGTTFIDKNDDYYNMSHYKRGIALIFNHYEFDTLGARDGTEKDASDIEDVLKSLKFDVEVYNDFKYGQIYEVLNEVSAMDHSDSDCLVIVVMTHGEEGVLYARDHQYPPDMLWKPFTGLNCPSLAGKPKLFFIQACRGDDVDKGVMIEKRTASDSSKGSYKLPSMADILVMYSAFPGYFSFRSTTQGSWFIQSLCEELKNRAHNDDLLRILTFVNKRVAINYESFVPRNKELNEKKQVGVIFSTLTRLLYFYLE